MPHPPALPRDYRGPRTSLYAMMLAAAGIPLYIHLPRFATVELGLGLGTLGLILMALRLVDLLQDPAFGWMIDRWPGGQRVFGLTAALGLALGFPLLFTAAPSGVLALTAVLILLFSAYSLGTILLYSRSEDLAGSGHPDALLRLALFREGGLLLGVIAGAVLPSLLPGYGGFGLCLAVFALVAGALSAPLWRRPQRPGTPLSLSALTGSGALSLLILAVVNALPVAITSTLFLFFVEDRLALENSAGPFLVLFFAAALFSLPLWRWTAARLGARRTLLIAMPLAIASFIGATTLGPGAATGFTLICLGSGAALGADMLLLPTLFSGSLSRAGLNPGQAFGLWSFAGKLGLALAAFTVLPLLDAYGFQPGQANSPEALDALTFAYALLPCGLKLLALALVWTLLKDDP